MNECEQWKLDNRMGGGALSLLAAYITDILSHILGEQANRIHSFSVRSPNHTACDSFSAFHLSFPSGVYCSANVAFSSYFEVNREKHEPLLLLNDFSLSWCLRVQKEFYVWIQISM